MAKRNAQSGANNSSLNRYDGGLNTNIKDYHAKDNEWIFARNAIQNSHVGDLGAIGNEPSNLFSDAAPYPIIGNIHINEGLWAIFSTDDKNSEIGTFNESTSTYTRIVNDTCLNFKQTNIIHGTSRVTYDCSYRVYWADGLNPDRYLDINNPPFIENCVNDNGCWICTPTTNLDCDRLRLESLIQTPSTSIKAGMHAGSIRNGSYQAFVCYTVNGQKVTDYFTGSNVLSLFSHNDINNSLHIDLTNLDINFESYQLVLVSTVAEKTTAHIVGLYSTHQTHVTIDFIDPTLEAVPLSNIPIQNPICDKSEAINSVNKYLYRFSPTSKLDFNYQPIANNIQTFWQSVEYPKDYYKNAGTNVGYMRDEVYAFFIRWIYNTGDKSKAYHIPGRSETSYATPDQGTKLETALSSLTSNNIEQYEGSNAKIFEVYNTADFSGTPNTLLPDGGLVIAEGRMGYWESTEIYDDKHPEIWDTLCGKPIRHHKFPENNIGNSTYTNHYYKYPSPSNKEVIRVLGVKFGNIEHPRDNNGNLISNIVGYEILRSSRNGNKTIIAKGLLNNMTEYALPNQVTKRTGLIANYPFNDVNPDKFLSTSLVKGDNATSNALSWNTNKKHHTFHSPDTMFYSPLLSQHELKIYGTSYGNTIGQYVPVDNHPKHKFITNFTFTVGIVYGVGYAFSQMIGKKSTQYVEPKLANTPGATVGTSNNLGSVASGAGMIAGSAVKDAALYALTATGIPMAYEAFTGQDLIKDAYATYSYVAKALGAVSISMAGVDSGNTVYIKETPDINLPLWMKILNAAPMFASYMQEGADKFTEIVKKLGKYKQFAYQYQAVCEYENFKIPTASNRRRYINNLSYLESNMQDYGNSYKVNHLLRPRTVMLDTNVNVDHIPSSVADTSRPPLISSYYDPKGNLPVTQQIGKRAASHYVAIKNRLQNQYGQLRSIKMLPTGTIFSTDLNNPIYTTGVIFGGDTYIGKYSEKNTFYYFYKWLMNQPNGEEFNYRDYEMLRYPTYWMDSSEHDLSSFFGGIKNNISNWLSGGTDPSTMLDVFPNDKHNFDRIGTKGWMLVKDAFMYLFSSGVRNFYVESELNIDYRDYENDQIGTQHYPVITDLNTIFNSKVITAGNYYKLDRSVSVNYLPQSKISWAAMQDVNYNPEKAETCYTYYPNRMMYSLPQEKLGVKDNWQVFLANNYQDYKSKPTNIVAAGPTGAMLLFNSMSPGLLPGVEALQFNNGTSITVGDGGLFAREMQLLTQSDRQYEYGSCQNRMSVINCPRGTYWMNMNQGKIFAYRGQGIEEISLKSNFYWFNQYFDYKILKDFPDFDLLDNPVLGVGCQSIYDTDWGNIYFLKKDYRLKLQYQGRVTYIGGGKFLVDGFLETTLQNENIFDDASWTISFSTLTDTEISWHDWHPELIMSGVKGFYTIKGKGIWQHNLRCDSYCNYYNKDYPFSIEFISDNMPQVQTVKSIEYYLQCYKFADNCHDRFNVLDFNFDEAVIYNAEQTSGVLRLNLVPKNDVMTMLQYPKIGNGYIDILYSKEENKYRFNQFWDIVKDRGEYSGAEDNIWITEDNGYIKKLNPTSLNYLKNEHQRKKFRHYNNKVLLTRNVSGNIKMIFLMSALKLQNSAR